MVSMIASVTWLCLSASLTPGQLPPPRILTPAPETPPPAVVLPAAPPVQVRPITLGEFAATFQPAPGTYTVVFVHPISGCPVSVCFTLPADCCAPKVRCHKHRLTFDYGKHVVRIRFGLRSKVVVSAH
jgi:hypothetical protein